MVIKPLKTLEQLRLTMGQVVNLLMVRRGPPERGRRVPRLLRRPVDTAFGYRMSLGEQVFVCPLSGCDQGEWALFLVLREGP